MKSSFEILRPNFALFAIDFKRTFHSRLDSIRNKFFRNVRRIFSSLNRCKDWQILELEKKLRFPRSKLQIESCIILANEDELKSFQIYFEKVLQFNYAELLRQFGNLSTLHIVSTKKFLSSLSFRAFDSLDGVQNQFISRIKNSIWGCSSAFLYFATTYSEILTRLHFKSWQSLQKFCAYLYELRLKCCRRFVQLFPTMMRRNPLLTMLTLASLLVAASGDNVSVLTYIKFLLLIRFFLSKICFEGWEHCLVTWNFTKPFKRFNNMTAKLLRCWIFS